MLAVTTVSPEALYSKGGLYGDLNELLIPVSKSTLAAAGLEVLPSFFVFNAAGQTKEEGPAAIEQRKKRLQVR